MKELLKCCICGCEIPQGKENNAAPLSNGVCCDKCNTRGVSAVRFLTAVGQKPPANFIELIPSNWQDLTDKQINNIMKDKLIKRSKQ